MASRQRISAIETPFDTPPARFDDIADFVATVRPTHSDAAFTLLGFSGGASLAMRIGGSALANLFDRYIAVSPAIQALGRPNSYAAIALPRIVALVVLNQIGIHWFDGLTTIAFATPPGNANLTGAYSFRTAIISAGFATPSSR